MILPERCPTCRQPITGVSLHIGAVKASNYANRTLPPPPTGYFRPCGHDIPDDEDGTQ